jgi:molybdate transport system substrate-binding protein
MPATIKFLCTTALKSSLDDVLPQFERAAGHRVEASYGPSAQLTKRLADGEAADAVVLTGPGFDEMTKLGKVTAASRLDIARSTTMLAVKTGTQRPDISTLEKFKRAMLVAKSLAYSGPGAGASGAHVAKVLDQLGIAEAMKPKTLLGPGGPAGLIGNYLVRGEAEIGIQQDAELMAVPGVDIVGPLPAEIGLITAFVFGIHTGAKDGGAAKALGDFLRTPAVLAVMKVRGLTPAQSASSGAHEVRVSKDAGGPIAVRRTASLRSPMLRDGRFAASSA